MYISFLNSPNNPEHVILFEHLEPVFFVRVVSLEMLGGMKLLSKVWMSLFLFVSIDL